MLKFLKSLSFWTASEPKKKPIGFDRNIPSTPSIPTTSAPKPENSEDRSAIRQPIAEAQKKQRAAMIHQLTLHEGMRQFPYKCTSGKTTIGIGRNLDDRGITEAEAAYLLGNDINDFQARLTREIPWMVELDPVRQRVLLDMAFNLGVPGLLKFKRTLAAIRGKEYDRAAAMMLDSRWATQVGQRSKRLSHMMATGHIPPELI